MSKLQNVTPEQAQGELANVYADIKKQMGGVIQLFQALGNSTAALNGYLSIGGLLKGGHLSAVELETISLVTAQANSCEYCLSAHTVLGKKVGMKPEEILDARKGTTSDPKAKALISFVREVISEKGRTSDKSFSELQAAGYTDAQVPEIFLAIVQNIYTNYFNNFNGTKLDFPKVDSI
ncbi:carboxymuconolactone decarboxylase family protein [bacterium]|nr:carboxymuconolactone decarboxylase family protein [bacterium]